MTASAVIGVDDWGLLTRRQKAFVIGFAALPLVFLRPAAPQLDLIFRDLDFTHSSFLGVNFLFILFWLVVVPAGVLCAANAFNMAAGYNGLESGIPIITSSFMVLILFLKGRDTGAAVIFLGLIGASLVMYLLNRYPAKIIVPDVGTANIPPLFKRWRGGMFRTVNDPLVV
jgi:UDP-N-acetylmuramyl pentapeptide phosphotransferase/UDP-N-acetylglucosamine-1-phosphate transferase